MTWWYNFTYEVSSELWRSKSRTSASGELWWAALQNMSIEQSSRGCSLTQWIYWSPIWVKQNKKKAKNNWQLIGWVKVTVGFCPSSTCKGEDQREQGVVTSGGKNQKYTSILPALNSQDARERGAQKQLHQLSVWLSPESTKTICNS